MNNVFMATRYTAAVDMLMVQLRIIRATSVTACPCVTLWSRGCSSAAHWFRSELRPTTRYSGVLFRSKLLTSVTTVESVWIKQLRSVFQIKLF